MEEETEFQVEGTHHKYIRSREGENVDFEMKVIPFFTC